MISEQRGESFALRLGGAFAEPTAYFATFYAEGYEGQGGYEGQADFGAPGGASRGFMGASFASAIRYRRSLGGELRAWLWLHIRSADGDPAFAI